MTFPLVTAVTAGLLLILQMGLGFAVSGRRGQLDSWVGDGGHADLQRLARRHANLAESAGLFVAGFTLLEMSGRSPRLLIGLCAAFLLARLLHAAGLSRTDTNTALRLAGGVATYGLGIALGGTLIWLGAAAALAPPA